MIERLQTHVGSSPAGASISCLGASHPTIRIGQEAGAVLECGHIGQKGPSSQSSPDGEFLPTYVYHDWKYYGTAGNLRASLRELDEKKSTDFQPQYTYKTVQKLSPGEIVPLDIEINPTEKFYHKGERLRVFLSSWRAIGGIDIYERKTLTEGEHVIHTGGQYDSYIQIPVVPPKYIASDTIYRA